MVFCPCLYLHWEDSSSFSNSLKIILGIRGCLSWTLRTGSYSLHVLLALPPPWLWQHLWSLRGRKASVLSFDVHWSHHLSCVCLVRAPLLYLPSLLCQCQSRSLSVSGWAKGTEVVGHERVSALLPSELLMPSPLHVPCMGYAWDAHEGIAYLVIPGLSRTLPCDLEFPDSNSVSFIHGPSLCCGLDTLSRQLLDNCKAHLICFSFLRGHCPSLSYI